VINNTKRVIAVLMFVGCDFVSPSGKLVQIEYALAAVASGAPSVGIKGLLFVVVTVC